MKPYRHRQAIAVAAAPLLLALASMPAVAHSGSASGGFVGGFLDHVTGVSLRPAPFDLMSFACLIQTLPPVMICLAAKAAAHRLNYITRIGVHANAARLFQSFQPERRRTRREDGSGNDRSAAEALRVVPNAEQLNETQGPRTA